MHQAFETEELEAVTVVRPLSLSLSLGQDAPRKWQVQQRPDFIKHQRIPSARVAFAAAAGARLSYIQVYSTTSLVVPKDSRLPIFLRNHKFFLENTYIPNYYYIRKMYVCGDICARKGDYYYIGIVRDAAVDGVCVNNLILCMKNVILPIFCLFIAAISRILSIEWILYVIHDSDRSYLVITGLM